MDNSFPGVPQAVLDEYLWYKSMAQKASLSEADATIKQEVNRSAALRLRLLADPIITSMGVWAKVSEKFPDKKHQVVLYNAAWMARIDYDQHRFTDKTKSISKRKLASEKVQQIRKATKKLETLIIELQELGYDSALAEWAGPKKTTDEAPHRLQKLIGQAERFDPFKIHRTNFVNVAIASQKSNPHVEYLRGFITLLHDRDFPIREPGIVDSILVPLATAALDDATGKISKKEVYRVIASLSKDKLSEHFEDFADGDLPENSIPFGSLSESF